jgi:hypothetical protein
VSGNSGAAGDGEGDADGDAEIDADGTGAADGLGGGVAALADGLTLGGGVPAFDENDI